MPLSLAIPLLILGLILGSIFTFGMQYWNQSVNKADCPLIETQLLSYHDIRNRKTRSIKEIRIDCINEERYFIDGVSINTALTDALSELQAYDPITIRLHPNSNTIVEMIADGTTLISFDETIEKLGDEATGFLFIGIFSYSLALMGLYYIIFHIREYWKHKKI